MNRTIVTFPFFSLVLLLLLLLLFRVSAIDSERELLVTALSELESSIKHYDDRIRTLNGTLNDWRLFILRARTWTTCLRYARLYDRDARSFLGLEPIYDKMASFESKLDLLVSQRAELQAKLNRWDNRQGKASPSSWKVEWAEHVKRSNEAKAAANEWKKTRKIKYATKIPITDSLYALLKHYD